MIGEVGEDASDKFVNSEYRPYTFGDNLTGVMNYPVRNFIVGLLTSENNDAEIGLMNRLALLVEHYPTNFLRNCLNNIGTHDTGGSVYLPVLDIPFIPRREKYHMLALLYLLYIMKQVASLVAVIGNDKRCSRQLQQME